MTTSPEPLAPSDVPEWSVGDRIRKARRHAGLTGPQLAAQMGVSHSRLTNWESGISNPSNLVAVIRAVAAATGVRADWIAGIHDMAPAVRLLHKEASKVEGDHSVLGYAVPDLRRTLPLCTGSEVA